MKRIKNIACIGGDERQKYTVKKLIKYNYNVDLIKALDENISFYDAFVLPLPATTDNIYINKTEISFEQLSEMINDNQIIFTGKLEESVKKLFKTKGIKIFDYYLREEFALKNAVPTALGVLNYVMNNSQKIVSDMSILVIGYGKCARAICKVFDSLGADVTSASRKYLTVAEAQAHGIKGCLIKDVYSASEKADIIINTVPVPILKSDFIDTLKKESMIIDISSAPYGFDYEYAKSVGKKINLLPSIPGKHFPVSAGEIIADTIINIIEEGGL